MYGGAVLSLALLFVLCTVINRSNRRAVRISLVVEAAYFICEIGGKFLVSGLSVA